ncbi:MULTISPECIES: flavin monoamine oxidase family protein [unclassified Nocardioides]|uniref:flavin monoamine oxidase family protein n=1 Tax=unclassified Nocardioides TaxID=2615069 RepID=UPI0007026193|nr:MULTISPECIES: FAD-dependent oxidoreductase [unclassified Nocardioides]KRC54699.1 amine oxidase [Nocardioides sp. Root79]KRC73955.1 amine oxidase [Nocardioides sp. Root240]
MSEVDVVVVGAGLAGLSAARRLVAAGKSVVVLEARDRVAGRNMGGRLSNGTEVELGGQWIGESQDVAKSLIAELGLELFDTYDSGDSALYVDGELQRFNTEGVWGLPPESAAEINRLFTLIEELAQTVSIDAAWDTPDAAALDRQTFDAWVRQNTDDALARRYVAMMIPAVFSAESPELSLLHFLFYVKSGTSWTVLISTTGGAQEQRVRGGTHLISERMAEDLGDRVRLNSVVRTIRQDDTGVTVEHETGSVTAQHAIVAVPQTLAGRMRYVPALPVGRDALTQQMPAGSVIKFQVGYDTPFWREDGLNGQVQSLDHAFNVVFDNSPEDASCGVIVGFIEGDFARRAEQLDADGRRDLVLTALVDYFGPKAAEPFDIIEQDWNAEEFTRGCYGGRLAAGAWTAYGHALAAPVGRIHWAGAETATVWNGYMDGAISSGQRAAEEILAYNV